MYLRQKEKNMKENFFCILKKLRFETRITAQTGNKMSPPVREEPLIKRLARSRALHTRHAIHSPAKIPGPDPGFSQDFFNPRPQPWIFLPLRLDFGFDEFHFFCVKILRESHREMGIYFRQDYC